MRNCSKAQVLTLKSNVSRMIDFPLEKDRGWVHSKKLGILVERYNYCSSPDPDHGTEYRDLYVLRGSLSVAERGEYCVDMVVWCANHEKEDKGRIKSWSQILRLKASDIERATRWKVSEFRVVTVLNQAGSLLVKVMTSKGDLKLCEYNLEEGKVRKVEASLPISFCYNVKMKEYIATLVPTKAY
ncbi:unnamed protein product [Arabis nemorensis]|uniref:F-box associated domain-containing protein n=1 Tax=Arabis nemorensis TaxID=586526 RepID=A0A565BN64_9BRAS|nr:unnamed protein product [Arabis nemorensis]